MSRETRTFQIFEFPPEEDDLPAERPIQRALPAPRSAPSRQVAPMRHRPEREHAPVSRRRQKEMHWLLPVGVAFLLIVAITAGIIWVVGVVTDIHDDLVYHMPRTQTLSQVVGHGDSPEHPSIFIARNISQQAVVQECPGGDMAHCINIILPIGLSGPGSEKIPVTMTFQDVNHDKQIDLLVTVNFKQQPQVFVYLNTGKSFRAATPNDHIQVGDHS